MKFQSNIKVSICKFICICMWVLAIIFRAIVPAVITVLIGGLLNLNNIVYVFFLFLVALIPYVYIVECRAIKKNIRKTVRKINANEYYEIKHKKLITYKNTINYIKYKNKNLTKIYKNRKISQCKPNRYILLLKVIHGKELSGYGNKANNVTKKIITYIKANNYMRSYYSMHPDQLMEKFVWFHQEGETINEPILESFYSSHLGDNKKRYKIVIDANNLLQNKIYIRERDKCIIYNDDYLGECTVEEDFEWYSYNYSIKYLIKEFTSFYKRPFILLAIYQYMLSKTDKKHVIQKREFVESVKKRFERFE